MGGKWRDGIGSDRIAYDRVGLGGKAEPGKGYGEMERNGKEWKERQGEEGREDRAAKERIGYVTIGKEMIG